MTQNTTGSGPSRRTVTRVAAWSVPVVAAAATAPAFAASCGSVSPVSGTIDWDSRYQMSNGWFSYWVNRWSRTNNYAGTYTLEQPNNTAAQGLRVSAAYSGEMVPLGNRTLRPNAPVGGLTVGGLCLAQYNNRASARPAGQRRQDRGAYTFTFDRPVTNLTFTVTDVDSATGDFWDMLELSSVAPFTVGSKGSKVTGSGSETAPYAATGGNTDVNDTTGSAGNVTVTFPGPLSSFTITYWNNVENFTQDTTQAVWVSDMTFSYSPMAGC